MKPRILVYTRFTEISRNALRYAAEMALDRGYDLLLVHNYDLPLSYAADPIAFASIHPDVARAEAQLKEEADRAAEAFPGLQIAYRLTYGSKPDAVGELLSESGFRFIVSGAPESQGEFWGWNDEFVDLITGMPIPVLIIPQRVSYARIRHIAFASDYLRPMHAKQTGFIRQLLQEQDTVLHIIHVSVPGRQDQAQRLQHKSALEEQLKEFSPIYVSIENNDVVASIITYIQQHHIELLVVIPHRHGIWHNIFSQRHTRRLTRINYLPIIALQD